MKNINIEYIITHYVDKKESSLKIAKDIGVSTSTVRNTLIKNGIDRRGNSESKRTYNINEDYFNSVNTPEKAYYLGFVYGDGCNSPHINTFGIVCQVKDREHLQLLSSLICPDKVIKNVGGKRSGKYVVMKIYNKTISEDLEKLGAIRNKTYTLKFPYFLEESLYRHFIRGVFDSDGCMSHYKIKSHGKYDCTLCELTICGTRDIAQSINTLFSKTLDIPIRKLKLDKRVYNNFATYKNTHPQQILKIYEYLYKDADIYLNRKKAKFEEFFKIRGMPFQAI